MAYSDALTLREQSAGIAGVAVIHAGLGALVVMGLAASVVHDDIIDEGLDVMIFPKEVPPPPPPKPKVAEPDNPIKKQPQQAEAPDRRIVVPPSPFNPPSIQALDVTATEISPIGTGDFGEIELPDAGGLGLDPIPSPTPTFAFDPVSARPRGDASRWITERDYRSSWIRRGMTGDASFQLGISATGRVTDCRVTRSTGHDALDNATCALIVKRARFNPAKDRNGDAATGSYSSSIRWRLPE